MQTLKTALVVTALLTALFVAYKKLNNEPLGLPFDMNGGESWPTAEGVTEPPSGVTVEAPPLGDFGPPREFAPPAEMAAGFPNSPVAVASTSSTAPIEPPSFMEPESAASATATETSQAPADPAESNVAPAVALSPEAPIASVAAANVLIPEKPQAGAAPPDGAAAPPDGAAAPSDATPTAELASPEDGPAAENQAQSRYSSPALAKYALDQAWIEAEQYIADGQLARALLKLSEFYDVDALNEDSRKKLHQRLDELAGTVIYSTRHLLEEPYKVPRGETLHEIAHRHQVPARLLQNINGVQDANVVLPGTELKVLRGPFRAQIDLANSELTLFLGGLYAGRFAIQVGGDPAPRPGQYDVLDIQPGRTYFSAAGQTIPAANPQNPYGAWWIDLGSQLSIHGRSETADPAAPTGCISLSPREAADVASILSIGSQVTIR